MLNSVSTREKQSTWGREQRTASCDACVSSVSEVSLPWERLLHMNKGSLHGWEGKAWPAGDTGGGGACVGDRSCAWHVTEPSGDGRGVGTAELSGGCVLAVTAAGLLAYRGRLCLKGYSLRKSLEREILINFKF